MCLLLDVHNEMMFYPEDLQRMEGRDFVVMDDMCRLLHQLQDEIHGPGGDPLTRWTVQYLYVTGRIAFVPPHLLGVVMLEVSALHVS